MKNVLIVVFGLLKMSFWVSKKGQLSFSEGQQGLKFLGNRKRSSNKFEDNSGFP